MGSFMNGALVQMDLLTNGALVELGHSQMGHWLNRVIHEWHIG